MIHAAFDTDAIIYAASVFQPTGTRIRRLIEDPGLQCSGSLLLLPEVLAKPLREASPDLETLTGFLARLDLRSLDEATADAATRLAATYGLRAADATHLATAVLAGADAFITNNRKDFRRSIAEIDIVYPDDLPVPT